MVAVDPPVTPTGFKVITAMRRYRDRGIEGVDRYTLAECVKAGNSTVHALLRTYINAGWVISLPMVDAETGGPCPTIYRLTEAAPTLDDLLGIEARV